MGLYAGIDVGTQSTKVILYDTEEKKVVGQASESYGMVSREDGTREQEAAWFTDAVRSCFSRLDPALKKRVKAIGVSGQQHGFVPVGSDGKAIAPVKLWCDTSTARECALLEERVGGKEKAYGLIGNQFLPGYTAGKILKMKMSRPDLWKKLALILLPHDWVNYWLTGRAVMEAGDASGTALFSIAFRTWSKPVLDAIDPSAPWDTLLPPLVDSGSLIGPVRASLARELGLQSDCQVSAGGGDNMMAAIGTGCVSEGKMTVSMGTSGTLFTYSPKPVVDRKGRLAGFCSSTRGWLPLLCTMNCTIATERVRALLGLSLDELNKAAEAEPVGSRGVTILPYFNGERTPDYPAGRAVFYGFREDTLTKGTLCRAAMESAVFALMDGFDAFRERNVSVTSIALTGGGAHSALWRQMAADVMGVPVRVPQIGESAALGGALQALWAVGEEGSDLGEICGRHVAFDSSKSAEPDPGTAPAYAEALSRFRSVQGHLAPLFVKN